MNWFIFWIFITTAVMGNMIWAEHHRRNKTWTTAELEEEWRKANGIKRK